MVKFNVEVQDWDDCYIEKSATIPCDMCCGLSKSGEYVIIDSEPSIPGINMMDFWKLNDIISDINNENPSMTVEYLVMVMEAVNGSLEDEDFVHRIKNNDFMFEDLSNINWKMDNEEIAACYIATKLNIPFDFGITKEILEFINRDEISDYIDWFAIWKQYELIGFKIIELEKKLYLIHWKN